MQPYLADKFGNPHSSTHRYGWEGEAALDIAREQVAALVGAQAHNVVFTSGATEANNLAIKGVLMQAVLRAHRVGGHDGSKPARKGAVRADSNTGINAGADTGLNGVAFTRPHAVCLVSEHKCVLESYQACQAWGVDVSYLPVGSDGLLSLDMLKAAMRAETVLVSVMAVNNEIGVIQDIQACAEIAHAHGALFHSDAAQACGKIPLNFQDIGADLMSLSAHKMYGPKGIGALVVADRAKEALLPHMSGGGQEGGLRSGTQAPMLAAGFGKACVIASAEMHEEAARIAALSSAFQQKLSSLAPGYTLIGHKTQRWAGNLNIAYEGLDANRLIVDMRGLAVSSGAACSSAVEGPSYVLEALGLAEGLRRSAIRIGFGRFLDLDTVFVAAEQFAEAVRKQQEPLRQ